MKTENKQKGKWRIVSRGNWGIVIDADSVTHVPTGYESEYKSTEKQAKDRLKKIND